MKILKLGFILLAVITLIALSCSEDDPPVVDDDNPVIDSVFVSITNLSTDEGSDYMNVSVQLQLDAASDQQITANISTTDGTAESNKDYVPISNQAVVFAAGETAKTIEITISGDMIFEEDEHFEVTIVSVQGPVNIDMATARVDILNDDIQGVQSIPISSTIDWDVLTNLPPESDIPYEVFNFGQPSNIPNEEFTSAGTVNDTILFEPKFSPTGDTLLYLGIFFQPGFNWPAYVDLISEPVSPGDSVELEVLMPILGDDINDVEFKYDLHIMIGTELGRFGPYIIDPKIRIQSQ